MTEHRPATIEEVSEILRAASEENTTVRARGAGTKWEWGRAAPATDVVLTTAGLNDVVDYNSADMTAVLAAGLRLRDAQEMFAAEGQMLAIDPPLGEGNEATIGGIFSTADSGPLRHRYGAPRDLVLGVTVVLADGTIARAGGRVIKNVAGYDLAKLFTGSFGTLGVVAEVVVRLHPLSADRVTARGTSDDPDALQRGAAAVSHAALQSECLDAEWRDGRGSVLARFAGAAAVAGAKEAERLLAGTGLEATLVEDDEATWARQREGQRSGEGTILQLSLLQTDLGRALRAAKTRAARLVARAGVGTCWLEITGEVDAIDDVRSELRGVPCVVRDAPATVREKVEVWGEQEEALATLTRRLKRSFDPDGLLSPGIFVGGI